MNQEKKKIGLTTKIFISLILGGTAGVILHYFVPASTVKDSFLINGVFYVIGNGFLRGMQMLVIPLVFCSLVCGSMAIGDSKTLGKIGMKIILLYLFTTAAAISLALTTGKLINPGIGLDISSVQTTQTTVPETTNIADTFLNIIPKNPIASMAEGNMLQIILFALIVGIILAKLGEKVEIVARFFSQCNDIMMEMTLLVMRFAPIGVFCLIAKTFAGIGIDGILPMFKYMLSVFIALGIQCFVVYMALLVIFTRLNPVRFIEKFFPVMSFAFSTATSNATIPYSIETLSKKMGVSKKVSSFTVPLGATINMDGTAIMQGVAVIFVSQAFHVTLTPMDYLTVIATATLASIGTAGIPGVGLVTLYMVFSAVGLPAEGIPLIMGIDRILDMARTAVNVTGDAVCTTIVAMQDKSVDKEIFNSN